MGSSHAPMDGSRSPQAALFHLLGGEGVPVGLRLLILTLGGAAPVDWTPSMPGGEEDRDCFREAFVTKVLCCPPLDCPCWLKMHRTRQVTVETHSPYLLLLQSSLQGSRFQQSVRNAKITSATSRSWRFADASRRSGCQSPPQIQVNQSSFHTRNNHSTRGGIWAQSATRTATDAGL